MAAVPAGLEELCRSLLPGSRIARVDRLAPDTASGDTEKAVGYGAPLRVTLEGTGGTRVLVFRTATANVFGHDRRSDRAQQLLLSFDTFGRIPDHVRALDVGAMLPGGRLVSLRESGELYLLTTFAEGRLYAEDLRRIAAEGTSRPEDRARCRALARWLVQLHAERLVDADGYRRAVRDLVGHGEGIFGMVDGYPGGAPGCPPERLRGIEERCLAWRWRLRGREGRLRRTHGDFHPFNVVFEGTRFTLLDASRGCQGDPADDVTCMAVNYAFFASDRPEAWRDGLGPLWRLFWETYLAESDDGEILEVAAPWLAWRCLVLSSPRFYPHLPAEARHRLLCLAEGALDGPRFDPAAAVELFR
jgi:aminoglycoside phosphotransferase (APT) family kinase protein